MDRSPLPNRGSFQQDRHRGSSGQIIDFSRTRGCPSELQHILAERVDGQPPHLFPLGAGALTPKSRSGRLLALPAETCAHLIRETPRPKPDAVAAAQCRIPCHSLDPQAPSATPTLQPHRHPQTLRSTQTRGSQPKRARPEFSASHPPLLFLEPGPRRPIHYIMNRCLPVDIPNSLRVNEVVTFRLLESLIGGRIRSWPAPRRTTAGRVAPPQPPRARECPRPVFASPT